MADNQGEHNSQKAKRLAGWMARYSLGQFIVDGQYEYPVAPGFLLTANDKYGWNTVIVANCPKCGQETWQRILCASDIPDAIERFTPSYPHECPKLPKPDPLNDLESAIRIAYQQDEADVRTDHLLAITAQVLVEIARRLPE